MSALPDPVHEAAREALEEYDARSLRERWVGLAKAMDRLRAALSAERVPGDRDRRAEKWLTDRHSPEWYIGDATDAEWEAAYAAVDAERVPVPITDETKVKVPMRTAQEIMFARDHLKNVSRELATAARYIKSYSPDSSVVALHIERQVEVLKDNLDDLLGGLDVRLDAALNGGE